MHVDEFIDDHKQDAYARWVLLHFRHPAEMQLAFGPFMKERKLFCTFESKRYRVTGASRFGDVWLTSDFELEWGYEHRVAILECLEWGDSP